MARLPTPVIPHFVVCTSAKKPSVVPVESEEMKPFSPDPAQLLIFSQTLNDPPSGPHVLGMGRQAYRDMSPRDTHC